MFLINYVMPCFFIYVKNYLDSSNLYVKPISESKPIKILLLR